MSLLWRKQATESRALTRFDVMPGAGATHLGTSDESALRLIPFYAGVSRIADDIACTPLHGFKRTGNGPKRVDRTLLTDPGVGIDVFTWKQQAIASLLIRGNAYGLILNVDEGGVPAKIRWLDPMAVAVDETGAVPKYTHNGKPVDSALIVHLRGFTLPGRFVGLSPVGLFKVQLETGLRVDRYAGDMYATGVAPTGHLRNNDRALQPEEAVAAKESFRRAVAGHDFWVSGNDWEWQALTLPANESMFLDTIKVTATQIAAILRIAPEEIGGEAGNSLTYSTLELNEMKYNRRTLTPWTVRFESALDRILPPKEYAKFNLDAMVRADLKTRYDAHKIGLETGIETLDRARALEEMAPLTPEEWADWIRYMQTVKGQAPAEPAARGEQA